MTNSAWVVSGSGEVIAKVAHPVSIDALRYVAVYRIGETLYIGTLNNWLGKQWETLPLSAQRLATHIDGVYVVKERVKDEREASY